MNNIDYILGQSINNEECEILKKLNPAFFNIEQTKIYNSLMSGDFSVMTLLAKHGQKTAAYAIEIANNSLKQG